MATLWVAMSFKPMPCSPKTLVDSITLEFYHTAGNRILQLDTCVYITPMGQEFIVTRLKYYIGNIKLFSKEGKIVVKKAYFLVNEEEPDSKKIVLTGIPRGIYWGMEMTIGVDSAHNCGGVQEGVLDPANAMFWAWNTGYIFLKLEGKSPASNAPGHVFEYHIGGYKKPVNCIRTVHLDFNSAINTSKPTVVHIKADVLKLLNEPNAIDFSKLPSVTDFHNATMVADNYATMFSVLNGRE
jgi:hypothetical protein